MRQMYRSEILKYHHSDCQYRRTRFFTSNSQYKVGMTSHGGSAFRPSRFPRTRSFWVALLTPRNFFRTLQTRAFVTKSQSCGFDGLFYSTLSASRAFGINTRDCADSTADRLIPGPDLALHSPQILFVYFTSTGGFRLLSHHDGPAQ
jgi:hypothetical protein